MTVQQTKQSKTLGVKIHDELRKDDIDQDLTDTQKDVEFQNYREEFFELANNYIHYRGEWNTREVLEFLDRLDLSNLNKICSYLAIQIKLTNTNLDLKKKLIWLSALITNWRRTRLADSREELYATKMTVEKALMIQTDKDNKQTKYKSITNNVESLYDWSWYKVMLNFWDWWVREFLAKPSWKSLVITDLDNNTLKCSVEMDMEPPEEEDIWFWQKRIINRKKCRVAVWNMFFVLAFND